MATDFSPWLWGIAGATIYAAPRWVINLSSPPAGRPVNSGLCTLEMFVAISVGCLAAGAFGRLIGALVLTTLHIRDDNATCALIGLLANRVAPMVVEKGSSALDSGATVVGRVLKALKGEEK